MRFALSPAELEVLEGVALGETAGETAVRLCRAQGTVKQHRRHVLSKLGARNAAHAVALGYRNGLLGQPVALINDRQLVAFQAKTSILAKRQGLSRTSVREAQVRKVAEKFGRELGGYEELTALEASWILDELDDELGDA